MKGYRKISDGSLYCSSAYRKIEDNYALDEDVRSVIHSSIIGENEKSGCEEYYVVVYKKVK